MRGSGAEGSATGSAPFCGRVSTDGTGRTATDGDAEAARSCSSRLGGTDGDDLSNAGAVDFAGAWKDDVGGNGISKTGNGRVESLKRRPLRTRMMVSGMQEQHHDDEQQQKRRRRRREDRGIKGQRTL
jgi:hypothetical protein